MAQVSFESLDVEQGFNFNRDVQPTYGFLYTLQIGANSSKPVTIESDIEVFEPMDGGTAPHKVVGVLSSISWEGGQGDPIKFKAQVSTKNRQTIQYLLHEKLS